MQQNIPSNATKHTLYGFTLKSLNMITNLKKYIEYFKSPKEIRNRRNIPQHNVYKNKKSLTLLKWEKTQKIIFLKAEKTRVFTFLSLFNIVLEVVAS